MSNISFLDPNYTKLVKDQLNRFMQFEDIFGNAFCKILKETGSLIAGGFILNSIESFEEYEPSNIYIYSTFRGAKLITDFLREKKITDTENQSISVLPADNSPHTESSFLRKNKIILTLEYFIKDKNSFKLKIMILDSLDDIIDTVTNFDLSFTQVWFDGEVVKATYPEHILNKDGVLLPNYIDLLLNFNPILIKRMMRYRNRGFSITYDMPKKLVKIGEKTPPSGKKVQAEEYLLNYLQRKSLFMVIFNQTLDQIIGNADMYIRYFHPTDFTLYGFVKNLRKIASTDYILPFWIRFNYTSISDKLNALILDECRLLLEVQFQPDEEFREFARVFLEKNFGVKEEEIEKRIEEYRKTYHDYITEFPDQKVFQNEIYSKEKNIFLLKDDLFKIQIKFKKLRKKTGNRNIPSLNIVDLIPTEPVIFDENENVNSKRCYDVKKIGTYNINDYLKGKAVKGYDDNGNPDSSLDIPRTSAARARERLVFFLANSSDNLKDLTPYCYNIRSLGDNVSRQLFVECEDVDTMRNISKSLKNPIIFLSLGSKRIYVPLGELLNLLYQTKKQTFILIPTKKIFKYTASVRDTYGNSHVSSNHCADGTHKFIHTVRVCDGDDLCWPVEDDNLKIFDYTYDGFLLDRTYYILENEIDKLESEIFISEFNLSKLKEAVSFLNEIGDEREKLLVDDVRVKILIEIGRKFIKLNKILEDIRIPILYEIRNEIYEFNEMTADELEKFLDQMRERINRRTELSQEVRNAFFIEVEIFMRKIQANEEDYVHLIFLEIGNRITEIREINKEEIVYLLDKIENKTRATICMFFLNEIGFGRSLNIISQDFTVKITRYISEKISKLRRMSQEQQFYFLDEILSGTFIISNNLIGMPQEELFSFLDEMLDEMLEE